MAVPANFVATLGTQERDAAGGCPVTRIEYAHLTWDQTSIGTDFLRYEIQRSIDGQVTWSDIAEVISEDLEEFDDYELPRGVLVFYRIRAVGPGAFAYSPVTSAEVMAMAAEWLFVSNDRPDLNVGLQVSPDREYTFPTTGEIVIKKLWGRDFHAAFRPLEQRGTIIALAVTAQAGTVAETPGVRAYDPIRAIVEEPSLPYVCVLDPYGNQFLSVVVIETAHEHQPFDQYTADLTVTQVTDEPFATLVSASLIWRNANLWRGAQTWRGVI